MIRLDRCSKGVAEIIGWALILAPQLISGHVIRELKNQDI